MACFAAPNRCLSQCLTEKSAARAKTADPFNRCLSQALTEKANARTKTAKRSGLYTTEGRLVDHVSKKQQSLLQPHKASSGNNSKSRLNKERKVSLPLREFNRLKSAAKVVSLEERLDALMRKEQETKRLEAETERKREYFKQIDDARKNAEKTNSREVDGEESNEQLKILEKAFLAKHEQEEEVKRANRIILDAKCHAVREAQVQEKYELQRELIKDEQRLEKEVLDRAIKALNEEDAKYERLSEEKQKYANDIKQQLNERQNARFLEAERIEEEAIMLRKANDAIKQDEERQAKLAKERRLKYREDLARVVEMSSTFRRMLCEQEKEAEMRIAAYMRAKEERLKALKAEQKIAKEDLERKQQRIYNLAEKILQSKSDREEMYYVTEQERIEREYRRKEKGAALRKKQIEKELAEARERQIQETKHCQALQIAREEEEFNKLINSLKEAEAKQKREDEQRELRRKSYRNDVLQQIGDNATKRRQLRELEKRQASAWRESERRRDSNIRAIITAKVNAMRDACLPDKYVRDVEKQLSKIVGKDIAPSKLNS